MREAEALGSPSSPHAEGRRAKDLLEGARSRAASALGVRAREVVFTASGTVAAQIGLLGAARARREVAARVVLSAVEHPAVADAAATLEEEGFEVARVPPEPDGTVDPERFLAAAAPGAAVAALVLGHHETGAILDVPAVAAGLETRGIPLLVDACLAPGRLSVRAADLGAPLVILSAHKFGGPRGVGLLRIARGTRASPLWSGGLQEERMHPGTENVVGAVGLSVALADAEAERPARATRLADLAARFLDRLSGTDGWRLLGPRERRLPGLVSLELPGVEGEAAMINLDLAGIAVSTGSTCALGAAEPSASLLAMGLTRQRASSTLRVSFGPEHAPEDATRAADEVARVIHRLRALIRG
jgi:cysteine desulfurase